ncbi:uncharacterized protein LOC125369797 [Ricinus communis]|uniref:uncharacterized protein LOC125369797 n=1 Tax=Ricinus communis TaxID=3988 RepID=UPI00201AFBCD|nr:uncharacterized protein LOC125369797 [Ricinus communis]
MATNTYQWQTPRARGPKPVVYRAEADPTAALVAQVELLSKKIEQLQMSVQAVQPGCEFCGGPHYSANCKAGGWRNHPNFGWRNSNNQGPSRYQRLHPQQPMHSVPHQPEGSQEKKPNLEELMTKFIATSENRFRQTHSAIRNQQASIQNLETQIGQLSRMMAERQPGTLPSNTESNPREHAKVDESKKKDKPEEKEKGAVEEKEDLKKIPSRPYQPPIPYPAKLNQDKVDQQFGNKRKLEDLGLVILNAECSAVFQSKIPVKRRDLGSFTIPCLIGDKLKLLALADLGASINLMPSSLFEELGLSTSKLTPTRMSIQLADRTVKYSKGIIEDVLVKVNKFIFPMDFVVMDMNGESDVPLILGRPFLATSKALIAVSSGKLELRVDHESITFDLTKSLRYPYEHDGTICSIDFINDIVESQLQEIMIDDPLQVLEHLLAADVNDKKADGFIDLDRSRVKKLKPSLEEPPILELKELTAHLMYAYLDEAKQLPVIISAHLTPKEREMVLCILRRYAKAFAYKTVDILGIIPSYCLHKILMEDEFKPVVQPQRRLNPHIKEMVKKEVIKLLDVGLIYPISDSAWVSPMQVVPKKGGMTVVKNEKEELIPTRTIPIAPEDQEKTTFTCPYGTFAYRRMPFGLCNAPATFQRYMMAIFHDMIEESMEVFMDDFSVFVAAVLGQRKEKKFQPIYYTSKMLTDSQEHYTTTEKELLAVVFAFDKFRSYLVLSKTIEFDLEIKDKRGAKNLAADHLSRLENPHLEELNEKEIDDFFLDEHLCSMQVANAIPWFSDYANYLAARIKLSGGVYMGRRSFKFSSIVMRDRLVDTKPQTIWPGRLWMLVFIG